MSAQADCRVSDAPAERLVHLCPECGGLGTRPTHRTDCSRYTGGSCVKCGCRFSVALRSARSPGGGRECFYQQACLERQERAA
jgi:hypothetical protein